MIRLRNDTASLAACCRAPERPSIAAADAEQRDELAPPELPVQVPPPVHPEQSLAQALPCDTGVQCGLYLLRSTRRVGSLRRRFASHVRYASISDQHRLLARIRQIVLNSGIGIVLLQTTIASATAPYARLPQGDFRPAENPSRPSGDQLFNITCRK